VDGQYPKAITDRYKSVSDKCAIGTIPLVESLFLVQQSNPDLLANPFEQAARCLVKAGVAPAGYSADSLKGDQKSNFTKAPYKVNNATVHQCLWSAGFAVAAG
jgi:hypothetical protein